MFQLIGDWAWCIAEKGRLHRARKNLPKMLVQAQLHLQLGEMEKAQRIMKDYESIVKSLEMFNLSHR